MMIDNIFIIVISIYQDHSWSNVDSDCGLKRPSIINEMSIIMITISFLLFFFFVTVLYLTYLSTFLTYTICFFFFLLLKYFVTFLLIDR